MMHKVRTKVFPSLILVLFFAARSYGQTLEADIKQVQSDITETQAEDARYSGGLIKALIGARLQILKQTESMLTQRRMAKAAGIAITYAIDGKSYVASPAARAELPTLAAEIGRLDLQITAGRVEVAKYSGGLVQAMTLSTVATQEQTRAMLEQKRLSITYSLPLYALPSASNAAPESSQTSPAPAATAPARAKPLEILDVASRITESNTVWSRFAWKLTVKNLTAATQTFEATIEFQDKDGFIVDSDSERGLALTAGEERVFTGNKLITADSVGKVARTNAKISGR
jgi:hypothetical protein